MARERDLPIDSPSLDGELPSCHPHLKCRRLNVHKHAMPALSDPRVSQPRAAGVAAYGVLRTTGQKAPRYHPGGGESASKLSGVAPEPSGPMESAMDTAVH